MWYKNKYLNVDTATTDDSGTCDCYVFLSETFNHRRDKTTRPETKGNLQFG